MFLLLSMASAAQQLEIPPLAWNWDHAHRLYVEAEVNLPTFLRVGAERNKNARITAIQIRSVMSCVGTDKQTPRKRQVRCSFEDIAFVGGALPGDRGLLQPILDEYDALFTNATLDLMVRSDGRIADVNLDSVPMHNLRTRQRKESMRLLARFLAAGMEVPLSKRAGDPLWASNQALLCTLPATLGTAGPAEAVHQATKSDGLVEIVTHGRGMMSPGESENFYTCEFAAHTFFDPELGAVQRTWTMRGEPTPSSPIAMGAAGYPYLQRGSLRHLDDGVAPDVGDTREVVPNTPGPSAIQQWNNPTPDPMDPSRR